MKPGTKVNRLHLALLLSGAAILIASGIAPAERLTWLLEVAPALIGGALLVATYRRFAFTSVAYVLMWVFALVLMAGGHWTYAEVPVGNWFRDAFGLGRNHFDRFGHLLQGAVPALAGRELLLRTSPLRRGTWLFFICTCIALAVSALYELLEWAYAVAAGAAAESFLGSQGDPWDAQADMFMALCGAVTAQLLLARWQDRQLRRPLSGGAWSGENQNAGRCGKGHSR